MKRYTAVDFILIVEIVDYCRCICLFGEHEDGTCIVHSKTNRVKIRLSEQKERGFIINIPIKGVIIKNITPQIIL